MDENLGLQHESSHSALSASAAAHLLTGCTMQEPVSRTTSPGIPFSKSYDDDTKRYRPRTFAYFQQLPFDVEEESQRDDALHEILKHLYISIRAQDFSPGALHWTHELQAWLNLKFEMTRELRAKLAKLFYSLSLAPGLENTAADRFLRMLITLTRKNHYLKPVEDLVLDWRPLWHEIKAWVLPSESSAHQGNRRRSPKQLLKLCTHAHAFFLPSDRPIMLEEFLPFFGVNEIPNAFIVIGLLNSLLPSQPAPPREPNAQPQHFFPTLFHLWSIMSRSKATDMFFLDLFSRIARDHLHCPHVRFSEYGVFTREQSNLIFTAMLRLTQIPVGQADSPYSPVDVLSGAGAYFEKDKRKFPVSHMMARLVVSGLTPTCLSQKQSTMSDLEGLIESIETFFHPSNQGSWTAILGQLILHLTDGFVSRWNREKSSELDIPGDRKINHELKRRFVLALKEVTYIGLYSKSGRVSNCYYNALQGLAYLEPDLILPGALQRFYPSLQGLVEVHRTISSLNGLQMIANTMCRLKGYRCHITALLALALPGIDANDLSKTQYTLNFIQSVAYSIPIIPMTSEDSHIHDTSLAVPWIQAEMDRMEREGQNVQIDYDRELSDEDEARILRSSTAGFGEFILTLLGKVFTLLENLPDASVRGGTPEDNVIDALPAALSPLFASLSPDLFDMALDKIATFVSSHVVHQARDAMAWIVNALCRVSPEKTLKVFVPILVVNIRNEIDCSNAASDRTTGADYLPRDRALVWHLSMLAMAVVHVGKEVLKYKDELSGIADYMQKKCRGLPTILVSNYIHHLLLNLTQTYPIDHALYEPEVIGRGLDIGDWGRTTPENLTIRWHQPSPPEIQFAVELFASQVTSAAQQLRLLVSDNPPVNREGKNNAWSDEVTRLMQQIRLVIAGMATMFDPKRASDNGAGAADDSDDIERQASRVYAEEDAWAECADEEELRPQFRYKSGYPLTPNDPAYRRIHELRDELGRLLIETNAFLNAKQEDDVNCFTALCSAYRTWITDVGIERSAHPLERNLRLYKADIAAFKIKGLRKVYPRPLLVKRAEAYHLLRLKHNSSARHKSDLDKRLLLDLAHSCLSLYADVRRVAQSAQDPSLKSLLGGKPLVVPVILEGFRKAIDANDHDRIKGSMYTLLFTSLLRTVVRDWRFAPEMMRLYIETAGIDKPSIQALGSSALYSLFEFGRPSERPLILETASTESIRPATDVAVTIARRLQFVLQRRRTVEESKAALGLELTRRAKNGHWKIATRCAVFATNLCLRFDQIAPDEFIDLIALGTIDPHPGLRTYYLSSFSALFTIVDMRAVYGHDYTNYLLEREVSDRNRLEITVEKGDAEFTKRFLNSFENVDYAEYMVDYDHPGWLVWGRKFTAFRARPVPFEAYDEVETAVRNHIGGILTKQWLSQCFNYFKQEPRDQSTDRFRMSNVYLLMHVFDLMHYKKTIVTLDDVKELTVQVYGDGSDKHQHRATSEILSALLAGSSDDPPEIRGAVWSFAAPMLLRIFTDSLTPENLQYWLTCLHVILDAKDPRRSHEIVDRLRSFRLDMSSNAAFKESSKVQLVEFIIAAGVWHFRGTKPIMEHLLAHVDHPYKAVREAIGRLLSVIQKSRYHESFESVPQLLRLNKETSSIGIRPYQPSIELRTTIEDVFRQLEKWRLERVPGQQKQSSYTSASKTVLTWLDCTLSSHECTELIPFFATPFLQQLLHMMDVKEDPELMKLAYHVYRHLPNIPFRDGEDAQFTDGLIRIGRTAASWHQRLRALINMQVLYFRLLFLTQASQKDALFTSVSDMLGDHQLEVRSCASTTLAGMIRCSPKPTRDAMVARLRNRFIEELQRNPMPQRSVPVDGRETPLELQRQEIRLHAAVLGLGALVEAFPYATPPPQWMPETLALLARKASGDSGIVGKATKGILSDFKKTRQDSWIMDQKLEDLEGVLWKSYFA